MTYVNYYECDYCQRRLSAGGWGDLDENAIKEGTLFGDGRGGHICKDCWQRQFSEEIAALGKSLQKGEV